MLLAMNAPYNPMNGAKGRARTLAKIRRERVSRAKAAGVDTTDRNAMKAFRDREFDELMIEISEAAKLPRKL